MKKAKRRPPHISQEDWDAVDIPPLTDGQLKKMRPMREVHPDLVEAYLRSRGRPKSENPKTLVSLRLDSDVLKAFKAGGPGWQTRINAVLAKWAKRKGKAA